VIGQWLLLILYGIMGLANVIRGIDAWTLRTILTETSLSLPVMGTLYLVLGLLFLAAGVVYFRKPDRRSRLLVRGLAVGYQVVVWAIHLLGDRGAYARRLWGRNLVLSLAFLALVFLITQIRVRWRR
jgi:hypothetical protein